MTIEELRVLISAETEGLRKGIRDAKSQLSDLGKEAKSQGEKISRYMENSAKKITRSFTSMAKTVAKVLSIAALARFGSQAIEMASNIEEVQNVVDVSFGKMSKDIDVFAKNAMTQFGLSELAAKKTASTFMAMSNGMGIARDAGKLMSMQLTALSGDMASFYNVSQEVANTALNSIFTGETETLKKFGIVLTEANLKEYALSQGIKKSYSDMSQAEKVALRYNYVMQTTAQVQGDFARTSGSWANQIRVLKLRWEEFMGVVGTILMNVFLPMVKVLNTILSQLIAIANTVAKLFGAKGIDTSGFTAVEDSVGGISDNFDDASKSAKKFQTIISGFDELNVLKSKDSGDGGGLGSIGSGFDLALSEPYDLDNLKDSQQQADATLNQIVESFNKGVASLNAKVLELNSVFAKAGTSLASGVNALVSGVDFKAVGNLLGNSLNDILIFLNNFRRQLDAYNLGASVANLINGIVEAVNWNEVADSFILKFNNIFLGLKGFLDTLDTSQYATIINNSFAKMNQELNFENVSEVISKGINNAFSIVYDVLKSGEITKFGTNILDTINDTFKKIDWTLVGETIKLGFTSIFETIKNSDFPNQLGNAIRELFNAIDIGSIISGIFDSIGVIGGNLLSGFLGMENSKGMQLLVENLVKVGAALKIIIGLCSSTATFAFFQNLPIFAGFVGALLSPIDLLKKVINSTFTDIQKDLGGAIDHIERISKKGVLFANEMQAALGQSGTQFKTWGQIAKAAFSAPLVKITAVVAAIAAVIAAMVKLYKENENFRDVVNTVWNQVKSVFDSLVQIVGTVWNDTLKPILSALWDLIKTVWDVFAEAVGAIVSVLSPLLIAAFEKIKVLIEALLVVVRTIAPVVGEVVTTVINVFTSLLNNIKTIFGGITQFISGVFTGNWKKAWEGVKNIFKGVWESLKTIAKAPINAIIGLVNGMLKGITSGINTVIRKINTLSWKVPSWVPGIGGQHWGFNFKTFTPYQIPYLAKGGVLTQATPVIAGEYPGASTNPEIVTPQNLLTEIINKGNSDVITAFAQMTSQLISAIEKVDMEVSIGDDVIAKSAARGNKAQLLKTGKPYFA